MKYSDSFNVGTSLSVCYLGFERLNLKLFSSHGGYLNVVIFVKHDRNVVVGFTSNFFPSIFKQCFLFSCIEIKTITEKLLKALIFGKDKKVNTEYSVNSCY